MDLQSISKAYFSNLNILAEKIAADIQTTQEAYQDLWHTLSRKEQNQAIDESIINPSAVLKYATSSSPPLKQNCHAYSWFCNSQLNLDGYDQFDSFGYLNSNTNSFCRSNADRSSKLIQTVEEGRRYDSVDYSCCKNKTTSGSKNIDDKVLAKSLKSSVLKPKNPPPPPPIVTALIVEDSSSEDYETKSNDIPKTGFDFLDNW